MAGTSASWWGVWALGRPCAARGGGVCSGSRFPGKAREGLWGPVLALPSSGVRDPPSRNPPGPPQFRGSSAGPWLRGGHRPVRLALGWSRAPPSSAGLSSLQVSEVASPPRCSRRSASCRVSWGQCQVFAGVPASFPFQRAPGLVSVLCAPHDACGRAHRSSCARFPKCLVQLALQWPSRLWAPSPARSSPSFSNPQRLRLPREARPEPQPSLLLGQTSVQASLVRVPSPRLSAVCPQRPQHPTCPGKHSARWCLPSHPPASAGTSPRPRPAAGAWMGEGPGCISAARAGGRPPRPPTPTGVGATAEGPAVWGAAFRGSTLCTPRFDCTPTCTSSGSPSLPWTGRRPLLSGAPRGRPASKGSRWAKPRSGVRPCLSLCPPTAERGHQAWIAAGGGLCNQPRARPHTWLLCGSCRFSCSRGDSHF